jgi:uncharacterized protein YndB with AHSA1/START domain
MHILLIILGIIAGIILLLLIIAAFLRKEYTVERVATINRPVTEVFDYIKYIRNQDNYSKWVMADPAMKKEFRGTDGTRGFVYAWDSTNKQVGKGEQEITAVVEGNELASEVRFIKPFEGKAVSSMRTSTAGGGTETRWKLTGIMKYPMNIMLLFMNIEGMLGKDMEVSLSNLKKLLEK